MHTVAKRRGPPQRTVLVVDDSPEIRAVVRLLFLTEGFAICEEAANGQDAIRMAKDRNPDLIVLDLSMPAMSGLDAAPKLREVAPKAPIILYTLHADQLKKTYLQDTGITAIVAKTEPLQILLQKAQSLLEA